MKRAVTFLLALILMVSIPLCVGVESEAATTKLVAITFDDGPSVYTSTLLDGLKARGAKATFFVVGNRVDSYPGVMRRIVAEGHQLCNHTYSHPNLSNLSYAGVQSELTRSENKIKAYGGNQTYAIRPPYGSYNSNVRSAAGGPLILWSVDTLDWQSLNANSVYNSIVSQTKDGSVVLLHDLYSTSVRGALRAIDTLKAQGYEFVTVNELFRRRCVTLERGKVYSAAYNKGVTLPAVQPPSTPTLQSKDVMGGKQISLSCGTANSKIYYTTNGATPDEKSIQYTGPITLNSNTQIKAVAYNGALSEVLSRQISVSKTKAPQATYADGQLTLCPDDGVTLYCTTDGSKPTTASPIYIAPLACEPTAKVLARSNGCADRYITYTVTQYGKLYTDISATAWYYEAVSQAEHLGVMTGVSDTTFAPNSQITRAMFVTALYRMADPAEEVRALPFVDCKANKWYSDAVAWAAGQGIVNGMDDTHFAPNAVITREQMCVILGRYMRAYGMQRERVQRTPFADAASISRWAREDVNAMYEMGFINGVGKGVFAPRSSATRAQCAKLLVELSGLSDIS